MFGVKKEIIADNQRGLQFRNGTLVKILGPGEYVRFDPLNRIQVEIHDVTVIQFQHRLGKYMVRAQKALTEAVLDTYNMGPWEVGLVYLDGILSDIIAPGETKIFWKGPFQVTVDRVDIEADFQLSEKIKPWTTRPKGYYSAGYLKEVLDACITAVEVGEKQVGLLMVDGKYLKSLPAGKHAFWNFNRSLSLRLMDCRSDALEVNGQEILSRDKVTLRINLSVNYTLDDPQKAALEVKDYKEYLYRELQLSLRDAVGTRTLDELLAKKGELNQLLLDGIREKARSVGLTINNVGVKDIILPGEMKTILNQVVEAEKQAQATLIRRREETAATRSLLNTAKMMENSPVLLRLKELEALEKVTEKIGNINVYGGMDAVLQQLVSLKGKLP